MLIVELNQGREEHLEWIFERMEGHLLQVKVAEWMIENWSCETPVFILCFDFCKIIQTPKTSCVSQR